jgi:hypothetical protein
MLAMGIGVPMKKCFSSTDYPSCMVGDHKCPFTLAHTCHANELNLKSFAMGSYHANDLILRVLPWVALIQLVFITNKCVNQVLSTWMKT